MKRKANQQHPDQVASDTGPVEASHSISGTDGLNRRSFLKRGGMAAAAAGLIAMPGSTAILGAFESDTPTVDSGGGEVTDAEIGSMSDALVAHVKNLSTGEISIYSGTREVVLRNPGLATQLFRASR